MFTGLIQQREKVLNAEHRGRGLLLTISRPVGYENLMNGESIAVDGACLTLVKFDEKSVDFFVGPETVLKTTLGSFKPDMTVNLERSLSLGDRMGGHIVTGHVDDTRTLSKRYEDGECLGLTVSVSPDQFRWVIPKGSICLNGVSLTINEISKENPSFNVLLIPETLTRTNLGELRVGDRLNVEFDQTVKIIAHQLSHYVPLYGSENDKSLRSALRSSK